MAPGDRHTEAQPAGAPGPAALDKALRRAHRAALAVLAICAIAIALQPGDPNAVPERRFALAAIGLAVVTIASRRLAVSPVMKPGKRAVLTAVALGCAAAIGLVAAALAVVQGAKQPALVFVLAAALVILRPPALTTRGGA